MARYTATLLEILQAANPAVDITNPANLGALAHQVLFKNVPLDLLSDIAQANFETQFTLHYLRDEIGFETFSLWSLALIEKIYNNYEEINAIYETAALQAYTEFEKTKSRTNGTRIRVGQAEESRTDVERKEKENEQISILAGDKTNTGTQETQTQAENEQSNLNNNVIANRGYQVEAKSGADTSVNTGTQENANNLTDTTVRNLTDQTQYNSSVTHNYGNILEEMRNTKQTEKNVKLFTTENERSFDQRDSEKSFDGKAIEKGTSRQDQNSMGFNFDAPQGSLDELRDPGGVPGSGSGSSAVGKGIDYATGQDYNYFSNAAENDATAWNDSTNERYYDNYKEHNKELGKEINKEKWNIDGTTNKDEREIYTKFEPNTADITIGQVTRHANGDVTVKSGSDQDVKSGADTLTQGGTETLSRGGTQTRTDNLQNRVQYGSEVRDTKNLDTTEVNSGTSKINQNANARVVDNLKESTVTNQTGNEKEKTNGTLESENVQKNNETQAINDDGLKETYKIDLLQWSMRPKVMKSLWDIFDDLFMWILN